MEREENEKRTQPEMARKVGLHICLRRQVRALGTTCCSHCWGDTVGTDPASWRSSTSEELNPQFLSSTCTYSSPMLQHPRSRQDLKGSFLLHHKMPRSFRNIQNETPAGQAPSSLTNTLNDSSCWEYPFPFFSHSNSPLSLWGPCLSSQNLKVCPTQLNSLYKLQSLPPPKKPAQRVYTLSSVGLGSAQIIYCLSLLLSDCCLYAQCILVPGQKQPSPQREPQKTKTVKVTATGEVG